MKTKTQRHHRLRTLVVPAAAVMLLISTAAWAGKFTVTRVVDGDTIRAAGHGTEITLRLAGIDAPELVEGNAELSQPYAEPARAYLEELLLDREVTVQGYGQKRHDLFVADVFLEGESISLKMVEAGLAEARLKGLPGDFDREPLRAAEQEARSHSRGMWSQGTDYVSPAQWRVKQRMRAACAVILFGLCGKKED